MLFIEYPKCSTCIKTKKYLESKNISFIDRNIVIDTPSKEELDKFIKLSGKDVNKFFNTSGIKYRELDLKNKLLCMSYDEKIELLASDGMLIKRPMLIGDNFVYLGYMEISKNV